MPHKPDHQDEGFSAGSNQIINNPATVEDASTTSDEGSRAVLVTVLEDEPKDQGQVTPFSTGSEGSGLEASSSTEVAREQEKRLSLNGDVEQLNEELAAAEVEELVNQVFGERPLKSSAAGFSGPVPLSSLNSAFQDFVLRTVGNEVLREFRYKGVSTSEAKVDSGKMSAARQVSVSFDDVREKNLKQLRKLNQVLFPVRYEEKFYTDVLTSGDFTKLAYYSDICVGAIASKLEKRPEGGLRLYIMTLGVLAPYRRLGIASKLLKHCLDLCEGNAEVHEVYLHVQTSRDEAIAFYKKFGFEIVETLENYYKRIDPPHAYVLMKTLQPETGS